MRGAVTSAQALNWLLAFQVGINTPRPPCSTGRDRKSLSRSVILVSLSLPTEIGAGLLPQMVAREGLCKGQCT